MSHNIVTINGTEPNVQGGITLPIDALSDVGAISDGQTIVYDSVTQTWLGVDVPTGGDADFALFGRGESNDYANSGFGITVGETWGFYDSAPVNYIGSVITFNKVAGTHWLESITLNAGTYEFFVQSHAAFSASGYIGLVLVDSSDTPLHQIHLSGGAFPSTYGHTAVSVVTLTFAAQETVRVRLNNVASVSATQGNIPSERGVIMVRRVL